MNDPINTDITLAILSHIFDGDEGRNTKRMKHIMIVFGRSSQYSYFVQCAKEFFFSSLFRQNNVTDLNSFIKKKIRRGDPVRFENYIKFIKAVKKGEKEIAFKELDRRNGLIVRYLSLYYGYIDVMVDKWVYDGSFTTSTPYYKFHQDPRNKDKAHSYRILKQKRIHNLEYYDKVDDAPNLLDCTFRLKRHSMNMCKTGATGEMHNVECLRVIG